MKKTRSLTITIAVLLATASAWGQQPDDLDTLLSGAEPAPADQTAAPEAGAAQPEKQAAPEPAAKPSAEAQSPTPEAAPTVATLPVQSLDNAAPPVKNKRVIEEIVVTAQKTEQTLQEVPVSVSVISGELIKNAGASDVGEIVKYAPNVYFNNDAGFLPVLTIRGFGTPPLGTGLEPSVGLIIDDVFYGRSSYANDAAFDIKRVEVLRGPQGTLFGKNTIAGVLSFTTEEPSFETGGRVSVTRAAFGETRLEGGVSFPVIADALAARISFRSRTRDTNLYNTTRREPGHNDEVSARIKTEWLLSDSSKLRFNIWKSEVRTVGLPIQLIKATPDSLAEFRKHDPATEADPFDSRQAIDRKSFSNRETNTVAAKFIQDFGDFGPFEGLQMNVIGGYSEILTDYALDADFSPINFIDFGSLEPDGYQQNQLELRFTSKLPPLFGIGDHMDMIVGAFGNTTKFITSVDQTSYYDGFADYVQAGGYAGASAAGTVNPLVPFVPITAAPATGGVDHIFAITEGNSKGWALFGQTTWFFSEQWNAVLGLRVSEDRRDGRIASNRDPTTIITPVLAGQENFDTPVSGTDKDFSPKLSLSWLPSSDLTFFGTVTRGFKSGGFASGVFNQQHLTFKPERAQAYELGSKGRFFDSSLQLNAAVYYTKYQDLQVRNFDGRALFVENAADTVSKGVEMDFMWLPPVDGLSVGGSAAFNQANYISYPCAPATAGSAPGSGPAQCQQPTGSGATGGNVAVPTAYQDLSGKPLAFAPRVNGSLYANWLFTILPSRGIALLVGADAFHEGGKFLDTDNDPNTYQKAVTKFNARLGLKSDAQHWSAILNVKNLTGEKDLFLVLDELMINGNYVGGANPSKPYASLELRYDWQ